MCELITTDELHAVFKSSRLPKDGYSFKKACNTPAVLIAMQSWVKALHKKTMQQPNKQPQQTALF